MPTQLVPVQEKGKSVDLEESVTSNNVDAAKKLFQDAVHLLCRPFTWHDIAGALSASFSIVGKGGEQHPGIISSLHPRCL